MKTDLKTNPVYIAFILLLLCLAKQVQAKDLPAKLDWAELYYTSVPVNGFVDRVMVHVGQRVNRGDKLLRLDTTVLSAKVEWARARVAALRSELKDAQRAYHDAKALHEQTVPTDIGLQRARMTFDIVTAKLDQAKAALKVDKVRLAQATRYSPWAAWVIGRHVESGQMITGDIRSEPLIILARADEMAAVGYVTASACDQLKVGQVLKVDFQNKVYQGKLQSIAMTSLSETDNSYALRVVFPVDANLLYRPGESASIMLP